MHIHEYQAKNLLKKYDIECLPYEIASSISEVRKAIKSFKEPLVLKAQIHAGDRHKIGAILFPKNKEELLYMAEEMIGKRFVNEQTGSKGLVCHFLMITPKVEIQQEYAISLFIDNELKTPVIFASKEGGKSIEMVSSSHFIKIPFTLDGFINPADLDQITSFWQLSEAQKECARQFISKLVELFLDKEALLLEINPFIITPDHRFICLDAKMSIDDSALFRHEELIQLFDPTQLSSKELKAKNLDFHYVELEGDIACMVNGAGLAMSTCDLIHYYGGSCANLLDLGNLFNENSVAAGFKLIYKPFRVRTILVHIFAGFFDCEMVIRGIFIALTELKKELSPVEFNHLKKVPIVVRVEGYNRDKALYYLKSSIFNFVLANSMQEAGKLAVVQSGIYRE